MDTLNSSSIDLIYTDPPFGTQGQQVLNRQKDGQRVSSIGYSDKHDDYLVFLRNNVREFHRLLKPTGTLYLHLDWHWVHYAKVILDEEFGRDSFLNEIIWAYDFGGRGKRCWPKKHDTILVYVKTPGEHIFNWESIDKIPYMAPGLQKDPVRAAEGKVPTDVWWMSIVGTQSKERNGYPNQKPVKLIERAIVASTNVGGVVFDPFAGSGTTGEAAYKNGRQFILSDISPWSIEVMQERFKGVDVEWHL
jgi:site-specific DNA-methyltransferase (adenine-specific)